MSDLVGQITPARFDAFGKGGRYLHVVAGLICALFVFSIGIDRIPVTDRDEARFAQASKQMATSGDWVDIRFQDAPRYKKPVGIYWAQTAAAIAFDKVGSAEIWVYRIPSVISAALASVLLIWVGAPLVGYATASAAAIMLASTFLLHVEARLAKTDAALLMTVVLAMGVLARAWCARTLDWRLAFLFWSALAAGVLIKGPLVLLPVGGAICWIVLLSKEVSWLKLLRPLSGFLWLLALVAPWYLAIILKSDGAFLSEALGRDFAAKIGSAQESHGAPPGSYFLTFWLMAWPWGILAPAAFVVALIERRDPAVLFLTGWIVPMWLLLELVPTKLLHYPLPVYPAILLLCALALTRPLKRWTLYVGSGLSALSGLCFVTLAVVAPLNFGDGLNWVGLSCAFGAFTIGAMGVWFLSRAEADRAVLALAASGIVMALSVLTVTIPSLSRLFIAERMFAASACHNGAIYIAGFQEPSAVFRLGTDTRFASERETLAELATDSAAIAWIAVTAPQTAQFVSGLNYSNGKQVTLQLFQAPGVPAKEPLCQERNSDK